MIVPADEAPITCHMRERETTSERDAALAAGTADMRESPGSVGPECNGGRRRAPAKGPDGWRLGTCRGRGTVSGAAVLVPGPRSLVPTSSPVPPLPLFPRTPHNPPMPDIDVLLQEHRKFEPPASFRAAAAFADPSIYARAARDAEAFWAERAKELDWLEPWRTVLEW